LVFGLVKLF